MKLKTTIHKDGTVTYWSVYRQTWAWEPADRIPDRELAAMPHHVRERVIAAARRRIPTPPQEVSHDPR